MPSSRPTPAASPTSSRTASRACSCRPADPITLASALARVLGDRELAERMGAAARARYADWHSTPEELAREMRALVDATIAGTAR